VSTDAPSPERLWYVLRKGESSPEPGYEIDDWASFLANNPGIEVEEWVWRLPLPTDIYTLPTWPQYRFRPIKVHGFEGFVVDPHTEPSPEVLLEHQKRVRKAVKGALLGG
jgi:hypothetical protein